MDMRTAEKITVELENGTTISTSPKGTIRVRLYEGTQLEVTDVYYFPHLEMNLLSRSKLDKKDISVSFGGCRCKVSDRENGNCVLGFANQS